MPKAKLTKALVQKITPDQTRTTIYWDETLPCLGLKVFASGRASYVAQFRLRGSRRTRQVTLGLVASLSPEQAREKARKHLDAARDGVDLDCAVRDSVRAAEEERKRNATLLTVPEAVDRFLRWIETAVSRRSKRTPRASTVRANGQWLSRF
jgi:Arm DNA-binding domain